MAAIKDDDYILHHHRGSWSYHRKGLILLMMGEFIGKRAWLLPRARRIHAYCRYSRRNLGATGM